MLSKIVSSIVILLVASGIIAFIMGNPILGGLLYAFPAGVAFGDSIQSLLRD